MKKSLQPIKNQTSKKRTRSSFEQGVARTKIGKPDRRFSINKKSLMKDVKRLHPTQSTPDKKKKKLKT